MLLLLNTYPLLVSEDLVFRSKATNLQGSVSVMVNALSGLDRICDAASFGRPDLPNSER